jgi:sterol desaturase/sphingolipid hydroxylase (fatty acid hydroxylase superfamily)
MGTVLSLNVLQVARLTAWLALLCAIFVPLEARFALRTAEGGRSGRARDVAYYYLNSLVPAAILSFAGAVLASAFTRALPQPWHQFVAGWPLWLRSLAVFLVGEFGFYWGHRWSHASPLLWRFHAVHHAAPHMDFLVNTRAHPVDVIFGRLCGLLPIYALGLAAPTGHSRDLIPLLTLFVGTLWGFFIHANVGWRFGVFEHLFATPAFHHWHHTADANRDRNFASMLPWVDRLFGTLHLPRKEWPRAYGIDAPMGEGLVDQLLWREAAVLNSVPSRPAGSSLAPQRAGEELRHDLVDQSLT